MSQPTPMEVACSEFRDRIAAAVAARNAAPKGSGERDKCNEALDRLWAARDKRARELEEDRPAYVAALAGYTRATGMGNPKGVAPGVRWVKHGVPLTARQQEVLAAAEAYLAETGETIQIRELGRRVGIASPSAVAGHVAAIEARGVYVPRVGKTQPYEAPANDRALEEQAQVERLRSLYWMHRCEAGIGRSQGAEKEGHIAAFKRCGEMLRALGAGVTSEPLTAEGDL